MYLGPGSLPGVFITPELAIRKARDSDLRREKFALYDLATHMLEAPDQVLPRFVELAMDVTSGSSAGLSLYEAGPPEFLRWHYLKGKLAPLTGTAIPKASPCGISMDQRSPQLTTHPERVFTWIADAHIILPEVLHIPLYVSSQEALGTLWVVADQPGHFHGEHARATSELASFVSIALRMARVESQLREALEEQESLAGEMSHRVKNVLTLIDALIRISARAATSPSEMAQILSGRVQALSAAQSLVRESYRAIGEEPGLSDFADILAAVSRPYDSLAGRNAGRFSISGPAVKCGEHAANYVALLFHELTTNATKYGALGSEDGVITISWHVEDGLLQIRWQEQGGLSAGRVPGPPGFGTKLIDDTISRRMKGTFKREWRPEGLFLEFRVPVAELER